MHPPTPAARNGTRRRRQVPSPARRRSRPGAVLRRIGVTLAVALTAGLLAVVPAHADPPAGAPIALESVTATADDHLFALAADHTAVYAWSGTGTDWTKIGGPAAHLYGGGAGLFATNPDTGKILRYTGTPELWTPVGEPGAAFAIAGDRLYGLSSDRTAVYQWSGTGTDWTKVGGPAQELYAGGAGLFATSPDDGRILRYDGTPDAWTHVGEPGAAFAVTGNHLYGLASDRTAVFEWSGAGTDWTKVGGPAHDLYAGGAGLFATNPDTGDIYQYQGTSDAWSDTGSVGSSFTVSNSHLYGLNPEHTAVFRHVGGTDWTPLGAPTTPAPAAEPAPETTTPPADTTSPATEEPAATESPAQQNTEEPHTGPVLSVTAQDDLYALAADRKAVWHWSGARAGWTKIGGPATAVYAGRAGVFATSPDTGDIYKYDGEPDHWSKIADASADMAVTGNDVYRLPADRTGVFKWTGEGTNWTQIGGPAKNLYASAVGLFSTNPTTGDIYRYDGEPDHWTKAGGPGATFAASDAHLYAMTPERDAVFEWTGTGTDWTKVGGPVKDLYAGGAGLFATNPKTGDIYRYDGEPDHWTKAGGPGATFAASDAHLYAMTPERDAVNQWTGEGTNWTSFRRITPSAGQSAAWDEDVQRALHQAGLPPDTTFASISMDAPRPGLDLRQPVAPARSRTESLEKAIANNQHSYTDTSRVSLDSPQSGDQKKEEYSQRTSLPDGDPPKKETSKCLKNKAKKSAQGHIENRFLWCQSFYFANAYYTIEQNGTKVLAGISGVKYDAVGFGRIDGRSARIYFRNVPGSVKHQWTDPARRSMAGKLHGWIMPECSQALQFCTAAPGSLENTWDDWNNNNGWAHWDIYSREEASNSPDKVLYHQWHWRGGGSGGGYIVEPGNGPDHGLRCDSANYFVRFNDKFDRACIFNDVVPHLQYSISDKRVADVARHIRFAQDNPAKTYPLEFHPKEIPGKYTGTADEGGLHRLKSGPSTQGNKEMKDAACDGTGKYAGWIGLPPFDKSMFDCDEYPFQSTNEGAANRDWDFSVRPVLASQNRSAGALLLDYYWRDRILNSTPDPFWVEIKD